MPLTATCDDKDVVFADRLCESDRETNYYFCRHCGTEMRLVLPKKNIVKHFRHSSTAECIYKSESVKHIEAKQFFYDIYKNDRLYNNVEIEKEWGGMEHDRIGDVVLQPKRKNILPTVIEIQNSQISNDEITNRFDDWNAFDITTDGLYAMMWVLTNNVMHPTHTYIDVRVPSWVRLLHRIYMGRVYIYSDTSVYAAHFDSVTRYNGWTGTEYYLKATKQMEVQRINNYNILQTNSGGGEYGSNRLISRFYDKKFW